ncbi:uncharacterized protein TRIADDRAFT_14507, partial [Trichoplax adhaerens]
IQEVPEKLIKLVKTVMNSYYSPEENIVVDLLIKKPCIKEDDIRELLKMEQKQLRLILAVLKRDKIIKSKQLNETADGRTSRYTFHYINFKVLINVIKYKLDHIRKRIQNEESFSRNRPSFYCPFCNNRYEDTDVGQLLDPIEQKLLCSYCSTPVEEDTSEIEASKVRTSSLVSFNEQHRPIFDILKSADNINLAPEILEPEPYVAPTNNRDYRSNTSRSSKPNMPSIDNMYEQVVGVNVKGELDNVNDKPKMEKPSWMAKSTVIDQQDDENSTDQPDFYKAVDSQPTRETGHEHDTGILPELLAHELASNNKPTAKEDRFKGVGVSGDQDEEAIGGNFVDDEPHGVEEESNFEMVVNGETYSIDDIDQKIIDQMTSDEYEKYVALCQDAYNQYY